MGIRRRRVGLIFGSIVVLCVPGLLGACRTAPAQPASVTGSIVAVAGLNPSVAQRPSPLRLRLYELKSPTAFNQADFMALYQSDQVALGTDLIAREDITLQPGETRPYTKALAPETRFLGVVAFYRDMERATWRVVVPVQAAKAQTLVIRADSLAIAATVK